MQSFPPLHAAQANTTDPHGDAFHTNETNYYAVICACSEYQNPKLNIPKGSPASEEKLRVVYDALLQTKNWDKKNIILLLNKDATRQNIISALEMMSTRVGLNDIFLFTWNGHGTKVSDNEGKNVVSICPYDSEQSNGSIRNVLTSDELGEYFSRINAKGKCLIFESCFSGGLVSRDDPTNREGFQVQSKIPFFAMDFLHEVIEPVTLDVSGNNSVVIMSTLPSTLGRATFITHSPLLYFIARIVKSAQRHDKNDDGILSAEEIFQAARPRMLLHSSLFYSWVWVYFYLFFKLDLYNFYIELLPGSLSRFFQLYRLYDKLVPIPALAAIGPFLLCYLSLQIFMKLLNGHFLLNWPNMQDNYPGELPLIEL